MLSLDIKKKYAMNLSIEKIRENICYSIKNKTVLTIVFKNPDMSHKVPQLVSCENLVGTKIYSSGIFPLNFYGEEYTFDLKDILGCKTYDVKKRDFQIQINPNNTA